MRKAGIDEIFILEEFRNKGIGTRTLEFGVQKAKEIGVNALHLEVEKHNEAGISLYRKLKFEDHQRILMTRWIKD
jgi:ribosomal protein S18 acetylase RimI-like enzyme